MMPTVPRPALLALCVLSSCAAVTFNSPARTPGGLEVRTFTRDSTNVHLVKKGDAAFLVDSGYEQNAEALEADLREAGVDPAKLKAIVLTHGHADHAGGARYFQQRYGVPVVAGDGDQGMLASGRNEPLCAVGFIASTRKDKDQAATFTGFAPSVVVSGTSRLDELVGFAATATLLPGHTRGSVVVTVDDVVLVGDLLRGSLVGSGAETHLYMCDLEDNRRGVARLLTELAPAATTVFVGHFGPVSRAAVADHFGVGATPTAR
jgi:glyoxylase-like metal-dependent hydrolase (beta-lactamase superfamily II)